MKDGKVNFETKRRLPTFAVLSLFLSLHFSISLSHLFCLGLVPCWLPLSLPLSTLSSSFRLLPPSLLLPSSTPSSPLHLSRARGGRAFKRGRRGDQLLGRRLSLLSTCLSGGEWARIHPLRGQMQRQRVDVHYYYDLESEKLVHRNRERQTLFKHNPGSRSQMLC